MLPTDDPVVPSKSPRSNINVVSGPGLGLYAVENNAETGPKIRSCCSSKGFGCKVQGCFYVRADRPNNSQLPLIVGNAACRAGNEAKTYKTFWPKVFEAGLFARSGYQPISHQLTPHTRGVAVGGAALTLGFRV